MTDTTSTHTTRTTRTPVDTVEGIYAAFGRGDIAGLKELRDPEVDWGIDVDAPGAELVPMLRHGRGHAAVDRYFAGVAELEFHGFDVVALHSAGETVLVEMRMDMTHRGTGKRAQLDEIHHWVVRDGRVVRYRPFLDTATMIEIHRA